VFDQPRVGSQQISINADYLGQIAEANETNNTAIANIQVAQTNNPQYPNNPGNLSCPNGYYLAFMNNTYSCYPNGYNNGNNNGNNNNCPVGYYSAYVNGTYTCYPNNNGNTGTGSADLQVRVLEIGTIDPYTNQFYASGQLTCNQTYPSTDCSSGSYFRAGQRIAVRFQIYNSGGQPSGQFYFRTDLGSTASQNRTSGPEASLQPGGTNTYTVGFDTVTVGQNTITIYADSNSSVNETSENNNVMRVNFTVSPYAQY
jgi:hypothetical protein